MSVNNLVSTILVVGIIGMVFAKRCEWLQIGCDGSSGGGGGGFGGGITAAKGLMIYKGTGNKLTGDLVYKDANKSYSMHSGHNRPSTRFIWGAGKGKGAAKCMNFNSYEATVYAKYGTGGSSDTRSILTGGGPGQRGNNCCVYSTGFVTGNGDAFAEEEGPHSSGPTIAKMSVQGGSIKNIGKLAGRTIGLKQVLIRSGGKVLLEGWVDPQANGQWKLFYRAINPKGGNLPVITKMPMAGENCGEVRFRTDGIWPVDIDASRSFVEELPNNAVPTTSTSTSPQTSADQTQAPPPPDKKKKTTTKKKKSKFAHITSPYYQTMFARVAI